MPRTRNVHPRSTRGDPHVQHPDDVQNAQFALIVAAAPYYRQATRDGQTSVFLDSFFMLWFTLWPDMPGDQEGMGAAFERQQTTRNKVVFDLCMAGVFNLNPTKAWEEFMADKLAESQKEAAAHKDPKPSTSKARTRPLGPRNARKEKVKGNPPPPNAEVIDVDKYEEVKKPAVKKRKLVLDVIEIL